MSKISRRQLLVFFGASAATTVVAPMLPARLLGRRSVAFAQGVPVTPVRLPHPLPIYQNQQSFMPTGPGGQGDVMSASADTRLSAYNIVDDVIVPPEYERYVIVKWGDRVFANSEEYVGYNNDYTGFVPLNSGGGRRGSSNLDDGYLWINHEYTSFPFSPASPGAPSDLAESPSSFASVIGFELSTDGTSVEFRGEALYNLGGSIIRITKGANGRYAVQTDSTNRRIHGLSGLGLNSSRSEFPSAWGPRSYQTGDSNYLVGTGPASTDVFPRSSDGLGNRIIGTAYNCSGGTTPWGTILTAEENFQGSSTFFVGVTEGLLPNGTQTGYTEGTTGETFGLVGEKYGWMVEIDVADASSRAEKHTAMGRFRHENITFRLKPGEPLVAYMGDDRRGGHTWKYVSEGTLGNLSDKSNSALFENGTLYVAKFSANGTGTWLPLELSAPTNPTPPSVLGSAEISALGEAQRDAGNRLPQRAGLVAGIDDTGAPIVATEDGGSIVVTTTNETAILPGYQGKTLADFYTSQGAVLCDAFLAANLIGATPSSRPEDLEVQPVTNDVFIAYTDHIAGGDGYPDSRIFRTGKLSADVDAQQPSGALYKITEDSPNGAGTTFRWTAFTQAGEAGADNGAGFANVDNLAFDTSGNVWGVTDMSTSRQNGFRTGAAPEPRTIDHADTGGTDALVGVFGNNWLFYIPTSGPNAGEVVPFAYGPPRCEMTGPTFLNDTLVLAVQHPGEDVPIGAPGQAPLNQDIEMLNLDGTLFTQNRTVPLGSNFPSNVPTADGGASTDFGPPRPCVIGIKPKG
ncbi:MAG: alkaline phosphatase PhoX [Cyanobacteria bacterium J06635_15]